jgi:hypothetical protein
MPVWTEIKAAADFQELFNQFDDFHDAVVRELYFRNPTYVDDAGVSFGSRDFIRIFYQGGRHDLRAIQFLGLKLRRLNLGGLDWFRSDTIKEASYLFRDNLIYWASEADWNSDEPRSADVFWFACERLFWRPITDGLGRRLRLANLDEYDPGLEALINP